MSAFKKSKVLLICLLTIFSFVIFGCKNDTPVDDISFNLGEGEQIVLMIDQKLELKDYVSIKPNYATNKKYSIISFLSIAVKEPPKKAIWVSFLGF